MYGKHKVCHRLRVRLLPARQVYSGKSDPVSVIQDGNEEVIRESTFLFFRETAGRSILSAGCEVTPGTKNENLTFFSSLSEELINE